VEELAVRVLARRFPSVGKARLESLARDSLRSGGGRCSSSEGIAIRAGLPIETLYLVLSGAVDRIGRGDEGNATLPAGAVLGERGLAMGGISTYSFRPLPGTELFSIPAGLWKEFLEGSRLALASRERMRLCAGFERMRIFEGIGQTELAYRAAAEALLVAAAAGEALPGGNSKLWIVLDGAVGIFSADKLVDSVGAGGIFGEEELLNRSCCLFSARAAAPTRAALIDLSLIEEYPVLLWRAKEVFERRLAAAGASFDFSWREEYEVGVEPIDDQHKRIFKAIEALRLAVDGGEAGFAAALKGLSEMASRHYDDEERMLAELGYPALDEHRRAHERLKESFLEIGARGARSPGIDEFMKDRFIRHTLIMDRQYIPLLKRN
jgi:hemerythrin